MPKLLVLSGLPGSGKSTEAANVVSSTGAVLVSRDELRKSLITVTDESLLTHLMAQLANTLLINQYNVVVDAWNLHPADRVLWGEIAAQTNAELEWRYLDTSVDECIRRDTTRPNPNGASRIIQAALDI